MNRLHRIAALALCIAALGLGGCDRSGQDARQEEPLRVYASFYPLYALTEMLAQDVPGIELHCLVQPQDGCLRAYSLSDWDFALLSDSADAVIAGGRGLESFSALLHALGEGGPAVSEVLYNMELAEQSAQSLAEETPEHWQGPNPHVYMSLDGAMQLLERIAGNLCVMDPEYEARYMENLSGAQAELRALQAGLKDELSAFAGAPVAVLNEALVYAARDYELEIACAYARESGEALDESALEDCLAAVKASGAQAVLIEKQAPQSLLRALEAAGYAVARMDVLSTRRADEGAQGYLDAQRANAAALKGALERGGAADAQNSGGQE